MAAPAPAARAPMVTTPYISPMLGPLNRGPIESLYDSHGSSDNS